MEVVVMEEVKNEVASAEEIKKEIKKELGRYTLKFLKTEGYVLELYFKDELADFFRTLIDTDGKKVIKVCNVEGREEEVERYLVTTDFFNTLKNNNINLNTDEAAKLFAASLLDAALQQTNTQQTNTNEIKLTIQTKIYNYKLFKQATYVFDCIIEHYKTYKNLEKNKIVYIRE
jgi:inorganic pyrophosphatase